MKRFQVINDIAVHTDFGPHSFVKGQVVEFLGDEVFPLVRSGHMVPLYAWNEAKQMKGIDSDLMELLHQIKTLLPDSQIERIFRPFKVCECSSVPAPYGNCHSFDMRLGPDRTLWPHCRKGKIFCPNAKKRKEVNHEAKEKGRTVAAR